MIVPDPCNEWFRKVGNFLGGYPDYYLVFDLETNGIPPEKPHILPTQVAWMLVTKGKTHRPYSRYIDWGKQPGIDADSFYRSVEETREKMTSLGKAAVSVSQLRAEGLSPQRALSSLYDILSTTGPASGPRLIGFNAYQFDRYVLNRAFQKAFGASAGVVSGDLLFDVGLVAKAHIHHWEPPEEHTPVTMWYHTVGSHHDSRNARKWNLAHCLTKYQVPWSGNMHELHDAAVDCICTGALMEVFRAKALASTRTE